MMAATSQAATLSSPARPALITAGSAMTFVVLLGTVSLFSDATYEGGRSLTGQYLKILGSSAAAVGIAAGAGEFLGYALRLVSGYAADRTGMYWLITCFFLGALFAPFVFLAGGPEALPLVLVGLALWGIGMAAQESVMRAALADMIPVHRRAYGFGLFATVFGVFWFAGSALMGLLYDRDATYLVVFSVVIQLAALPIFWLAKNAPVAEVRDVLIDEAGR